jgi:hypothetical protein
MAEKQKTTTRTTHVETVVTLTRYELDTLIRKALDMPQTAAVEFGVTRYEDLDEDAACAVKHVVVTEEVL